MPVIRLIGAPFLLAYQLVIVVVATIYVGIGWVFTGEGYVKITWPSFR